LEKLSNMATQNMETATLGGGCFWCTEAIMLELNGVDNVVPGYSGGHTEGKPSYREVCTGTTGHAEVIQVRFDPDVISYEDLMSMLMTPHAPTADDRHGADRGTQYRWVICYHDEDQKKTAEKVVRDLARYYGDPIVTVISPLGDFYEAEEYLHDYYRNNPG